MEKIKLVCAALLLCVATSIKHNAYTLEKSKINDIITENYIEYPLEWEICSVNNDICCMYDVTISEKWCYISEEVWYRLPEKARSRYTEERI